MTAAGRVAEGVAFTVLFAFYGLTVVGAVARGDVLLCLLLSVPLGWMAGQAWARAYRSRHPHPATVPAETTERRNP